MQYFQRNDLLSACKRVVSLSANSVKRININDKLPNKVMIKYVDIDFKSLIISYPHMYRQTQVEYSME